MGVMSEEEWIEWEIRRDSGSGAGQTAFLERRSVTLFYSPRDSYICTHLAELVELPEAPSNLPLHASLHVKHPDDICEVIQYKLRAQYEYG